MNVYRASVVKPKGPRDLKFACFHCWVLADDLVHAKHLVEEHYEHFKPEHLSVRLDRGYEQQPRIFDNGITMLSAAELRKLKGEPEPTRRAQAPRLSSRPLGETQRSVLRSLAKSRYPGGWLWDTHSGTVRILESLYQRCLVDKSGGVYTINDAGRAAISEARSA